MTKATLKVMLCACLLPGCSAVRYFHNKQLASKSSLKTTDTVRNFKNEGFDDLIPPHPAGREYANEMEVTQVANSGAEDLKPRLLPAVEAAPVAKAAKPEDDDPLVQALRHAVHDRPNDALKCLESFDAGTQDLLLRLLPMLSALNGKGLEKLSPEEIGNFHEQLESMLSTLRPRTDLIIDKMCCCGEVKGFGNYTPLAEGQMLRPDEVVWLYVELRNFCAEAHSAFCEPRLSSRAKIYDAKNPDTRPLEFNFDVGVPNMRVPRTANAWYQCLRFTVPRLPPGVYTLTLTVTDESQAERKRIAEKSMEFRVK